MPNRKHAEPVSRHGICIEQLESRRMLNGDVVVDWNDVFIEVSKGDVVTTGPVRTARNAAMFHAAIYDTIAAIKGLDPLMVDVEAHGKYKLDQAIASAATTVLKAMYPAQEAKIDEAYDQAVDDFTGHKSRKSVHLGEKVGNAMMAARADDGSTELVEYVYHDEPGYYQATIPGVGPVDPNWGNVTPFVMDSVENFLVPPPPALDSAQYAAAYNQVKELGSADSTTRTADQTEIGYFWAYDALGYGAPVALYNQVIQAVAEAQGNSPTENAFLFAVANMAMADAGIAAWNAKYDYEVWRPVTGIQNGDADGNPLTEGDPDWQPLGAPSPTGVPFTPPFPAYPSGHSTFGGALFETLRRFYGTDDVDFTLTSDELPGVTREFTSFTQAETENGISRIYLGVHWIFDNTEGIKLGNEIANYVADKYFGEVQQQQPAAA